MALSYAGGVYLIPNLQAFRNRQRDASRGPGSLHGSGLSQVEGLDSFGEMLTSIDQFPLTEAAHGMSHSQPDLLVSAEHRLLVLSKEVASLNFGAPANSLVRVDDDDEEMVDELEDSRTDQELLSRGELDIAGMDRMLDSMSGSRFGRSTGRRVGFAAS